MRDTANGLNFTAVTFYDGQGFLVRRNRGVTRAKQLDGATICVISGTTQRAEPGRLGASEPHPLHPGGLRAERRGAPRLRGRPLRRLSRPTQSSSPGVRAPSATRTSTSSCPTSSRKEPLAPAVRHGDDQWFDIVRWTVFALIEAEELGITRANVDELLQQPEPGDAAGCSASAGDHGPADGARPALGLQRHQGGRQLRRDLRAPSRPRHARSGCRAG